MLRALARTRGGARLWTRSATSSAQACFFCNPRPPYPPPHTPHQSRDELRRIATELVRDEQWLSAHGVLEGLVAVEAPGSAAQRRALSERAMCKHSLHRVKEAVADYEAALEGQEGRAWPGAHVALLNYAELQVRSPPRARIALLCSALLSHAGAQGSQEEWAMAEGLGTRAAAAGPALRSLTQSRAFPSTVRQALTLMDGVTKPEELGIVGAARANLGTYLGMQGRHEQAATELTGEKMHA